MSNPPKDYDIRFTYRQLQIILNLMAERATHQKMHASESSQLNRISKKIYEAIRAKS